MDVQLQAQTLVLSLGLAQAQVVKGAHLATEECLEQGLAKILYALCFRRANTAAPPTGKENGVLQILELVLQLLFGEGEAHLSLRFALRRANTHGILATGTFTNL